MCWVLLFLSEWNEYCLSLVFVHCTYEQSHFLFCSGRGIWRCLYDPNTSLLVTGGFDSAIKAHRLHSSVSAFSGECISEFEERRAEVLRVCIPNSSGQSGFIDRYTVQQIFNLLFFFFLVLQSGNLKNLNVLLFCFKIVLGVTCDHFGYMLSVDTLHQSVEKAAHIPNLNLVLPWVWCGNASHFATLIFRLMTVLSFW